MADISKIKVQGTDYNIKDATARNAKAFGTVTVGTTNIAADSASDTLTLAEGDNITLTPDAANGKITIAAKGTTGTMGTMIGGTNLLMDTGNPFPSTPYSSTKWTKYSLAGSEAGSFDDVNTINPLLQHGVSFEADGTATSSYISQEIAIKNAPVGFPYTFSCYAKALTDDAQLFMGIRKQYERTGIALDTKDGIGETFPLTVADGWKHYSYTYTIEDSETPDSFYDHFYALFGVKESTGNLVIMGMKLEIGTVATDWSPCPGDSNAYVTSKMEILKPIQKTE